MRIAEIFESIQGETTRAGSPCVFVRLVGCNLDCKWCDTGYARAGGDEMEPEEVLARVADSPMTTVCVTGGEPLLQDQTPVLLGSLNEAGLETVLMTSGSLPLASVPKGVVKVVDVKSPWSQRGPGAPGSDPVRADTPYFHPDNLGLLEPTDEVKFVVESRVEFEWACDWALRKGLFDMVGAVLVGPAWNRLQPSALVDWILESRLPFRLNLQLHKYVWGGDTRR